MTEKKPPKRGAENLQVLSTAEILRILGNYGFEGNEVLAQRLSKYLQLLLRWNQKISLTAVTDPTEIVRRHFGESVFGAKVAGISEGSLLDVGSGAGFPAVPVLLECEKLTATLLEPNLKKSVFLAEVARELQIEDRTRIGRMRLEDFCSYGARFNFVTTRAVKISGKFFERARTLLAPKGKLVLWTTKTLSRAMQGEPGWEWDLPISVPQTEERVILCGRRYGAGR